MLLSFSDTVSFGRGLYSLVDWNLCNPLQKYSSQVEAYTALWIEISISRSMESAARSRLIQPRGLKSISRDSGRPVDGRGLYSLVDWNHGAMLGVDRA